MNDTIYELTCPHCGLKYTYDRNAGDPEQNALPITCVRCGQTEQICNFYRINRLQTSENIGVKTRLNEYPDKPYEPECCWPTVYSKMFPSPKHSEKSYETKLMGQKVMTEINEDNDPHVFRHPATLVNPETGESITMSVGEQIVGRIAPVDGPKIGFHNVPQSVSRRHVCINTVECGNGKFINMVSNCKNKNRTLLNDKELPAGDVWKMARGMTLTMGELTVRIEDI